MTDCTICETEHPSDELCHRDIRARRITQLRTERDNARSGLQEASDALGIVHEAYEQERDLRRETDAQRDVSSRELAEARSSLAACMKERDAAQERAAATEGVPLLDARVSLGAIVPNGGPGGLLGMCEAVKEKLAERTIQRDGTQARNLKLARELDDIRDLVRPHINWMGLPGCCTLDVVRSLVGVLDTRTAERDEARQSDEVAAACTVLRPHALRPDSPSILQLATDVASQFADCRRARDELQGQVRDMDAETGELGFYEQIVEAREILAAIVPDPGPSGLLDMCKTARARQDSTRRLMQGRDELSATLKDVAMRRLTEQATRVGANQAARAVLGTIVSDDGNGSLADVCKAVKNAHAGVLEDRRHLAIELNQLRNRVERALEGSTS